MRHHPKCVANAQYDDPADHDCTCALIAGVQAEQQARDFLQLWAQAHFEDRRRRDALIRGAIRVRGRLTDDDVFRLTGTLARLADLGTVKQTSPDKAYQLGVVACLEAIDHAADQADFTRWTIYQDAVEGFDLARDAAAALMEGKAS